MLRNIPVPEAPLAGIAAACVLHVRWRRTIPGSRSSQLVVGCSLVAAGAWLAAQSVRAAGRVDLTAPDQLVASGPYSAVRNPMYVGWTLLHLGVGLSAGSGWAGITVPAATAWVHREVLQEERALTDRLGEPYRAYRADVPRYLPSLTRPSMSAHGCRPAARSPGPEHSI